MNYKKIIAANEKAVTEFNNSHKLGDKIVFKSNPYLELKTAKLTKMAYMIQGLPLIQLEGYGEYTLERVIGSIPKSTMKIEGITVTGGKEKFHSKVETNVQGEAMAAEVRRLVDGKMYDVVYLQSVVSSQADVESLIQTLRIVKHCFIQ